MTGHRATPTGPDGQAESTVQLVLDHTRFAQLLAMAGPEHDRELVEQLVQDLEQVFERLAAGWAPPNWGELGAQSHVLIALAGAIGARSIQSLAEALNQQAHQPDNALLAEVMPALLDELDALIGFIAGQRHGSGA